MRKADSDSVFHILFFSLFCNINVMDMISGAANDTYTPTNHTLHICRPHIYNCGPHTGWGRQTFETGVVGGCILIIFLFGMVDGLDEFYK